MSKERKRILAINGSTRKGSSNYLLLKAMDQLAAGALSFTYYESIANLPHFDPDINFENVPDAVVTFRQQIQEANGVLICTPEYAHGVPGSLKNAIDWTVGTGEFSNKPTVLITASTDGRLGHQALLETLKVIEAQVNDLHLVIQFVRTKVNAAFEITDIETLTAVEELLERFEKAINNINS